VTEQTRATDLEEFDQGWLSAEQTVTLLAEDTCPTTATPIRIDFRPNGYERVDPPETVAMFVAVGRPGDAPFESLEEIEANVCVRQPFFASADAARSWLAATPGARVFTVQEIFERPAQRCAACLHIQTWPAACPRCARRGIVSSP